MSIQAKIARADLKIASAPEQTVSGSVTITPGDNVALALQPEDVASYARDGRDLVVQLKNGEVVRVVDFYGAVDKPSHLYLIDDQQQLLLTDLDVAADGTVTATYAPQGASAEFAALGAVGGGEGGGIGLLAVLGGLGLAGGIAAAASGGGDDDGNSRPPAPAPDTTPPGAATGLSINAAGTQLTGSAEPNATVLIDTNRDGTPDVTVTAGANGAFTATLAPPLTNGETVSVTVRDAAGNVGPAATVAAPDSTAPSPATGLVISDDGTTLTGSAEAGSTVRIDTNGDGTPDVTVTAGANGAFTATLTPPLTNGETVSVTVRDAAGNTSTPATVMAADTTAPAPATGLVISPDGATLTGSAEAGATVSADIDGDGTADLSVTAGADGRFQIPLSPPLTDGQTVSVVVTDGAGNASTPATVIAPDTTLVPPAPTIDPTNGTEVAGSSIVGYTVTLLDANGSVISTTTVDATGAWSFTPATPFPDGTLVQAFATNPQGDRSATVSAIVDAVAPATPVVDPSNGTVVTGSAEAGAAITLTGSGGTVIGSTVADANGDWSITPATPLADGTVVSAIARDAAGNASAPASATIDAAAPAAPIVDPSNGTTLTGTAEAGSIVLATDAAGTTIGQAVADAAGNWSITPAAPLADGTVVTVRASDAVGNVSPPASATIDATAPSAPVFAPSNGVVITGTAEAGSTVTFTDATGTVLGQATADANGAFRFTPGTPLADGTVVQARATDAAGNTSGPAAVTIDAAAPAAPTVAPSNGTALTGTAEAGSTVTLTDGNGVAIGQTTADAAGNWSFTPAAPLADGTTVAITATDAAGNTGPATGVTIDAVAPAAPVLQPSNGTVLVGSAEAGSTVTISIGGTTLGQVTADTAGNWSFTPATPIADDAIVSATATDAAGNVSAPGTVIIDASLPSVPSIDPTNGTVVSGSADPGNTVTVTDLSGAVIGQTTVDANGDWSITPASPLADGTTIRAVATTPLGATSAAATAVVDAAPPAAPAIDPSNGAEVSGLAEAGATVTLTDGNGVPIGTTVAGSDGAWSFTPAVPLADGSTVRVTATDAVGNVSAPATITVDAVAPAPPVFAPTNGAVLTGTAEAGSIVTITAGGSPVGTTTADANGNWTFAPTPALADGVVVSATATDAAGNVSGAGTATVDGLAPGAPVIAPSNGVVVFGTAEAGATVTLTDGAGGAIGTTIADAQGGWTFTPGMPLPNGTVINATATDVAGNVSVRASTVVDAVAPGVPVIDPTNGTVVQGSAEAGATITLTDANGNAVGSTVAGADGRWSITPAAPIGNATVLIATARDAAGNVSGQATAIVDALPPAAPIVAPSNGDDVTGTAEAGATVTLSVGGVVIGTTTAGANASWSFSPGTPLADGTTVSVTATDAAGNVSPATSIVIDGLAPLAPTVNPTNGTVLTGTAEIGATVTLTDGTGTPIGTTTANASGNWSFAPAAQLPDGLTVRVTATDAAGNISPTATTVVDGLAPAAPSNLVVAPDGTTLTGTAEAGSQVRIVVDGDTANPLIVTANAQGSFTATFPTPVTDGQPITATATDAAGNTSGPATVLAPDLGFPVLTIAEAADGFINAAEIGDGIQVSVALNPGADAGDTLSVTFAGQNGYVVTQTLTLSAADILAGTAALTLTPPMGMGAFPEGASSITANINSGPVSAAVSFVVDTIPPATPILSLVGNLLTISGEPNSILTVEVDIAGTTATVTVQADNSGLASLDLLTDLDIGLSLADLLNASVSVTGSDLAGNESNVATLAVGNLLTGSLVTIGNFGLDVALLPPTLGFSGQTEPGSSLRVEIVTPAITVIVAPPVDANGNFGVNLLDPAVLSQLGLTLTGLLNLGAGLGFNVIATDADGNDSARYGISLTGSGLALNLGEIAIDGTNGSDVLSGMNGTTETINAGAGSDLILNVGTNDEVNAGSGDDSIQLTAANFDSVDGGAGFDTVLLAGGIDIDYNGAGVGTLTNIERIDLGTGDSGSVLTLTSAEVDAVTDAGNTLQITGEANDQLIVTGAVDTGQDVTIEGIVYDVWSFGNTILQVEQNTVTVVE